MRKIIAVIFLFAGVILFLLFLRTNNSSQSTALQNPTVTQSPLPTGKISQNTLFVPYWSTDTITPGFSTYVYFGISPVENGIDTTDAGYSGIPAFIASTQRSTKLLTLSMLNKDLNAKILQDSTMQENIIQDTLHIASTYGFDGIVLDLEYSGLAFDSVTKSITNFSTRFARETKAAGFSFYQTLYGDTFYLVRPYNVGQIAQNADGIYVLAYDFHKANGTPGPNFPLTTNDDADYSFTDMISDFLKKVPAQKLTVIFGMYGYDWTVDSKNRTEKMAESMSDIDIVQKFLQKCKLTNCVVKRNITTQESSVTYKDSNGENHVVWFEDMQSIGPKEKVLQENHIQNVGFWANGYF